MLAELDTSFIKNGVGNVIFFLAQFNLTLSSEADCPYA